MLYAFVVQALFSWCLLTYIMYFSNLHSISKDLWWSTGSVAGHSLIQAPVLDTVLRQGYKLPTAEKKESRPESSQILNSTTKWRFLFWISFFLTKHHQLPFSCILLFSSIHMLHLSISQGCSPATIGQEVGYIEDRLHGRHRKKRSTIHTWIHTYCEFRARNYLL